MVGRASEPELRGLWFDPHTGHRVQFLRKMQKLTRVLVITLEALASFQHGLKVVAWDVKP